MHRSPYPPDMAAIAGGNRTCRILSGKRGTPRRAKYALALRVASKRAIRGVERPRRGARHAFGRSPCVSSRFDAITAMPFVGPDPKGPQPFLAIRSRMIWLARKVRT